MMHLAITGDFTIDEQPAIGKLTSILIAWGTLAHA
jgi:hypothetical protein